jgi:hypothetical protein
MKVATLSESPGDEAALRAIATAVLGDHLKFVKPQLRARGWPSVLQVLPAILRHLHFRTDTLGIMIVVDSDDSIVHEPEHDLPGKLHSGCRLCLLRAACRRTMKNLPPANGRRRIHTAVGLAVPAIEAWLLCGKEERVTEDAWILGQEKGRLPYTRRELKHLTYGTVRPSLPEEIHQSLQSIGRHRGDMRRLENDFPRGFGPLVNDLRTWSDVLASGP